MENEPVVSHQLKINAMQNVPVVSNTNKRIAKYTDSCCFTSKKKRATFRIAQYLQCNKYSYSYNLACMRSHRNRFLYPFK